MTVETFMANFGHLADAPNGVKKLRELILQLAVQGKLVEQNSNDEPASVLLERVEAEKEQLVKGGKIKKQKPFPAIADEEKPFDLPKGWEFVRFGDITNRIGSGSTPRGGKNAYVSSGFPFLRSQNIWNHGLELRDVAYIAEETHKKMSNTVVFPGDILLNITGASLGRCTIFPAGIGEANVSQHVTIIRPTMDSTKAYLHLCVLSPYTQALVWGRQVGMAREGLSKKVLELFEIPLPPFEEQKRIVAKVDQLMALCDELEARQQKQQQGRVRLNNAALDALLTAREPDEFADHWQRISTNFDLLYDHPETIAKLRSAILQLAVQGKLVPQDPNDEPAGELLKKIEEEKLRLVGEKRIKPPKPLPEIQSEDLPYTLPRSWEWVYLGALSEFINGDRSKKYPNRSEYVSEGIPWINTGHIEPDGSLTQRDMNFITREKFDSLGGGKIIPGDLLYCLRGATFGKTAIVDPYYEGAIASSLMIIRPYSPCSNQYLYRYLISPVGRSQIFRFDNGSAQPNLSANSVRKYAYPLPPLAEQYRIVAKVNQLMTLCDELEAKLNQTQQHSEKLMIATVRQLLMA